MGLEETPEAYVEAMVALFREVRRVLKDDGTLWLNLGDSYFPHNGSRGNKKPAGDTLRGRDNEYQPSPKISAEGLKGKDLIGIPWRVAFALQQDGWYLRSDIIWHKPNPMPESVTDRPTKSHEYVFLLSKSPRYYYDQEAIREPVKPTSGVMSAARRGGNLTNEGYKRVETKYEIVKGANRRDVWTINTKPFKGAHFAVMPEALVEPCILAGSKEGDLVLDPFTGSGTVAVVSLQHGRNFIGTELNPNYAEIAQNRIAKQHPGLDLRCHIV
jgi:DNA modification methylase